MNSKALRIIFLTFETLLTLIFIATLILGLDQGAEPIAAATLFAPLVLQALFNLVLAFFMNIYFKTASTIEAQIMPTLLLVITLENIEIFQLFESAMFIHLVNSQLIAMIFSFASIFGACLFIGLGMFQQNHSYTFAENFVLTTFVGSILLTAANSSNTSMTALKANSYFSYLLLILTILAFICFFISFVQNHNRVNLRKQVFLCMMALGNYLIKSEISIISILGVALYALGALFFIGLVRNKNLWA